MPVIRGIAVFDEVIEEEEEEVPAEPEPVEVSDSSPFYRIILSFFYSSTDQTVLPIKIQAAPRLSNQTGATISYPDEDGDGVDKVDMLPTTFTNGRIITTDRVYVPEAGYLSTGTLPATGLKYSFFDFWVTFTYPDGTTISTNPNNTDDVITWKITYYNVTQDKFFTITAGKGIYDQTYNSGGVNPNFYWSVDYNSKSESIIPDGWVVGDTIELVNATIHAFACDSDDITTS